MVLEELRRRSSVHMWYPDVVLQYLSFLLFFFFPFVPERVSSNRWNCLTVADDCKWPMTHADDVTTGRRWTWMCFILKTSVSLCFFFFILAVSHLLQGVNKIIIIECIYTDHSTLKMIGSHNKKPPVHFWTARMFDL